MIRRAFDRNRRRGLATAAVLICLFFITLISLATLRASFARRQMVRSNELKLQAEWLAEAGIERARSRIAADAKYSGETWSIAAVELDSADDALVVINVEPVTSDPKARLVRVRADYPREPPRRARHSRELVVIP
jgi:Tfp pilus assembly protein PilX